VDRSRQLTIFAPVVSTFPDELNDISIHPDPANLPGEPAVTGGLWTALPPADC
jgi:hypothetical protein